MVACPICEKPVREADINRHIDSGCESFVDEPPPATQLNGTQSKTSKTAAFFTPAAKKTVSFKDDGTTVPSTSPWNSFASTQAPVAKAPPSTAPAPVAGVKRSADQQDDEQAATDERHEPAKPTPPKKQKSNSHSPLAELMRPQSLD